MKILASFGKNIHKSSKTKSILYSAFFSLTTSDENLYKITEVVAISDPFTLINFLTRS